jgi:hypothetical protein
MLCRHRTSVESSGNQKWVHWRWACPKFLRQTFHEWAWLSTRESDWAKSFYDQQRERKKSHHAAIRALAFKRLRILSLVSLNWLALLLDIVTQMSLGNIRWFST